MTRREVEEHKVEEEEPSEGRPVKKDQGFDASGGDPTYEMACVRRYITGAESISQFIENSRKMFLLQVIKIAGAKIYYFEIFEIGYLRYCRF